MAAYLCRDRKTPKIEFFNDPGIQTMLSSSLDSAKGLTKFLFNKEKVYFQIEFCLFTADTGNLLKSEVPQNQLIVKADILAWKLEKAAAKINAHCLAPTETKKRFQGFKQK